MLHGNHFNFDVLLIIQVFKNNRNIVGKEKSHFFFAFLQCRPSEHVLTVHIFMDLTLFRTELSPQPTVMRQAACCPHLKRLKTKMLDRLSQI